MKSVHHRKVKELKRQKNIEIGEFSDIKWDFFAESGKFIEVLDFGGHKGFGVVSKVQIPQDQCVTLFTGDVKKKKEAKHEYPRWQVAISNGDNPWVIHPTDGMMENPTTVVTVGHLINHSVPRENVAFRLLQPEAVRRAIADGEQFPELVKQLSTKRSPYRIVAVVTKKTVLAQEELFLDYGWTDYDFTDDVESSSASISSIFVANRQFTRG